MDKSSIQFKKTKWLDLAWYDIMGLRAFHIKKIMCSLLLQNGRKWFELRNHLNTSHKGSPVFKWSNQNLWVSFALKKSMFYSVIFTL